MGSNLKDWRSYGCWVFKDMEMVGLLCCEKDLTCCKRELMGVPLKEDLCSKKEVLGLGVREEVRAVVMAAVENCLIGGRG